MSDFLNDFEKQMKAEAAATRRSEQAQERERQEEIEAELEFQERNTAAKQKAVEARRTTLDWAWAAAELLNDAKVQPEIWTYTHFQKRRFFGRTALQGIAAEGWKLLDWQNTHYWPKPRHTLLLTPHDHGAPGVHLQFFSQIPAPHNTPTPDLLPEDVHTLSKEPLSRGDMQWPPRTNGSNGIYSIYGSFTESPRSPKPRREAPWKETDSLTIDTYDVIEELRDLHNDMADTMGRPRTEYFMPDPTETDYEEYRRSDIEGAIRRAIARLAAKHLITGPEKAAKAIEARIELGFDEIVG